LIGTVSQRRHSVGSVLARWSIILMDLPHAVAARVTDRRYRWVTSASSWRISASGLIGAAFHGNDDIAPRVHRLGDRQKAGRRHPTRPVRFQSLCVAVHHRRLCPKASSNWAHAMSHETSGVAPGVTDLGKRAEGWLSSGQEARTDQTHGICRLKGSVRSGIEWRARAELQYSFCDATNV
jgi:hypothetical protein